MNKDYPKHLLINGRNRLTPADFLPQDKLYRGFVIDDLHIDNKINFTTIRFPNTSCNWERFSNPEDVRLRPNGKITDGCYSFTVEASRYKNIATPVHDPINESEYENYSHVEIRALYDDEDILFEPPKDRKKRGSKSRRQKYRKYISMHITIEIYALE